MQAQICSVSQGYTGRGQREEGRVGLYEGKGQSDINLEKSLSCETAGS